MPRIRCSDENCSRGKVYTWGPEKSKWTESDCPVCQGLGFVLDRQELIKRFKNPANIALAEGFLQALIENPYDQETRAIYADWLEERDETEEAAYQRNWTPEWQDAEDYIDDYAMECHISREELIEGAKRVLAGERDEWWGFDEAIVIGIDTPDIACGPQQRFWRSFSILTGIEVPEELQDERFVSCSC